MSNKRLKAVLPPALAFLAVVIAFGWYVSLKAPPPHYVPVVIAAATIPRGTVIQGRDLHQARVRRKDHPPGALFITQEAVGQPAVVTIVKGQPLFPADVGHAPPERFGLAPGQEGMTVKLDDANQVADLAPGDWVTAYVFYYAGAGGAQPQLAEYSLRARIVALLTSGSGGTQDVTPTDVRLAVPQQDAAAFHRDIKLGGSVTFDVSPWPPPARPGVGQ